MSIANINQVDINGEPLEVDVVMHLSTLSTKSDKIRYLTSLGWKRGRIAKHLGIIYQHVRNVQLQPLKKK